MKNLFTKCVIILTFVFITFLSVACKSIPQADLNSPDFINRYYATSDDDCSLIFDFINQSNKTLKVSSFISEKENVQGKYNPATSSPIITVDAGECLSVKYNAKKLLKDFNNTYCVGINCFEKGWCWWQTITKDMKYKRIRIIVKDDTQEGGQMLYPPFKSQDRFDLKEITVEYENKSYPAYLITNTPDKYAGVYDTRIFYSNNSNNSSRISNIFNIPCKNIILDLLNKGDFTIAPIEGYKFLVLNKDPLDLNIYNQNEDYDFIYEVVNNTSDNLLFANMLFDEDSNIIGFSNDIEIEQGQSYQFKYKMDTLKKVYGDNSLIGIDLKKSQDERWTRGWSNNFDHKNEKYTIVVSDGTQGRLVDVFYVWNDFPLQINDNVLIY